MREHALERAFEKIKDLEKQFRELVVGNGKPSILSRLAGIEDIELRRARTMRWLMGIVAGTLASVIGKILYDTLYFLPQLLEIVQHPK